jgi:hypothetical protein
MSFAATLRLMDATSNVLDDTAVAILTDSVATVTGVQNSEVTLESYIAVRITSSSVHNQEQAQSPVFRIRDGERKRLRAQSSQQHHGNSVSSLFQSGIMQRGAATLSDDVQYYKISAVLRITAKLADYPAYNNDVDALYTALSTALTTAVADNSLQTQIVSSSIAADSATFASISAIETVAISPPVVGDPSAAQDNDSSEAYEPGEVAGMVIALMFGLGLVIFVVFRVCCRPRKPATSDAHIVFDPIVPEATSPSTPPPPAAASSAPSGVSEAVAVRSARQVNVNPYEPGEAVGVEW